MFRQVNVALFGAPGLLLEAVQDVDGFGVFGDIEDTVLDPNVYPDLVHARADAVHGSRVMGLQSVLNQVELMSGSTAGVFRERSEILERGPYPEERLFGHDAIYNFLYTMSTLSGCCGYDGVPIER
jgi:hypothetical protein